MTSPFLEAPPTAWVVRDALRAHEVLRRLGMGDGEASAASSLLSRPLAAHFIGRQRELEVLGQAFAEARAGAPRVVLIEGESGMGKSALVRRFIELLPHEALALDACTRDHARALSAKLADALANAGRGAQADEAYLRASEGAPPYEELECKRRAAESYLCAGYVDEGRAVLCDVIAAVGL